MENLTKRIENINIAEFCRMKADDGFIQKLVDKYCAEEDYSIEELKNCWELDETHPKKYIVCVNSDGDCFIEEFFTRQACMLYLLDSEISLEDCLALDTYLNDNERSDQKC